MSYYFIMLAKQYRLKKRTAFNATYKFGTSKYINGFMLYYGKTKKENDTTKIGFVVGKKVHKRAVKRNKLKRQMREVIRLYINDGKLQCKYLSLVFMATSKSLTMNYNEISNSLTKLLEYIKND